MHAVDFEIFIDGAWISVGDLVRVEGGTKIGWGSTDGEQNNRPPARADLVFDNRGGEFSPLNAENPWYGKIARNTPVRIKVDGNVRFSQGLASYAPKIPNLRGKDLTMEVDVAGLRQRLGSNRQPLKGVLERGMPTMSGVVGYWPLTDGKWASEWNDTKDGPPAVKVDNPGKRVKPANYNDSPAAGAIPTYPGGAAAYMRVRGLSYPTTGYARVMAFMKFPDDLSGVGGSGYVLTMRTTGIARAIWQVKLNAAGSLGIDVRSDDGVLDSGGFIPFDVAGKAGLVWIYVRNTTPGNVDAAVGFAEARYGGSVTEGGGTYTGFTGAVTGWDVGNMTSTIPDGLAGGHVSVHNGPAFWDAVTYARAFESERAATRFARLAAEEGVAVANLAPGASTERMGPQQIDTFLNLMDECADADDAMMWDDPINGRLNFRPRQSMYTQPAVLTIDYAAGQLSPPFDPVLDDRGIVNDVTVERVNGAKWRSTERGPGPLSVDTIGYYSDSVELNLFDDSQPVSMARWLLHRGTVDGLRAEKITVDVGANPGLLTACMNVQPGTFIDLVNLPDNIVTDDVRLLALGVEEYVDEVRHTFTFTCLPGSPFEVAYVHGTDPNTNKYARVDHHASTTASAFSSGNGAMTQLVVNVPTGSWTTLAGDVPFTVRVSGAVLTVTAVSAVVAGQQTFTVSTTVVNGVGKPIPIGSEVHVEPTANVAA